MRLRQALPPPANQSLFTTITRQDNSAAVDVSAETLTMTWARQIRLSFTAFGSGNALNGSTMVGSMMRCTRFVWIDQ